jgi:hypothetical protein
MKLLTTFLILLSTSALCIDELGLIRMDYIIQSDVEDASLKKGYYRIRGEVKMFSSALPLPNVLSGCTSSGTWIRTDSSGKFDLLLKSTDSVVYFYLDGWSEVVIEDYLFREGHMYDIDVFMNQVVKIDAQINKRKPVMYLYSEKDENIIIDLDPYGKMAFTYPKYEDSWEVNLISNKLFVQGRSYPYLFWEATSQNLNYSFTSDKIEGAVVAKADLIAFFEKSLTKLGLNQTEMTDFITYWVPALSVKDYCFIQFILDEQYDAKVCGLKMSPSPASSKRIFILASELDSPDIGVKVIPQKFSSFERKGLTIVEWGGAVVDFYNLSH